jgi:Uma2 family endonuclease
MSAQTIVKMTDAEYLAFERASDIRHEFLDGEIFAMAGAGAIHGRISTNLSGLLFNALRRKSCEVFSADLRVHIPTTGLYTYPDLLVVCGQPQFLDNEFDTLLNPKVIIEILSPSTEAYDRGAKFADYMTLPSLAHYVLVSQDRVRIEVFTRQEAGPWLYSQQLAGEKVELPAIEAVLVVDEVYENVEPLRQVASRT